MQDNLQRGQVTVMLNAEPRTFHFGMATMLAYTQAHGIDVGELQIRLHTTPIETLIGMVAVALKRQKAADLPEGDELLTVAEWLDQATQEDADKLMLALTNGMTANPLLAAMNKKEPAPETSPSA